MLDFVLSLRKFAEMITHRKIVLIGMGGSSLGPEVLRAAAGTDRLIVLDTTDPSTIAEVDPNESFFLVSSKSGNDARSSCTAGSFLEIAA